MLIINSFGFPEFYTRALYPPSARTSLTQRFSDRCRSTQSTSRAEIRLAKDASNTILWPRTEAGSSAAIPGRAEAFFSVLTHNTLMSQLRTSRDIRPR